MAEKTGISWADSTMNFWIGCTEVGPGCDNCYAIGVGKRMGVEWGRDSARRQTSLANRNEPHRWQRKAAAFHAEHGHPRRVFCSSLADVFDNEVPDEWRAEAFATMEATPDLRWQICTKRVSNVAKMIPRPWALYWPQNVGLLITTVTPEEVARDVPRLVELKRRFGIPWVGLSVEPMIADIGDALLSLGDILRAVDWLILDQWKAAKSEGFETFRQRPGRMADHDDGRSPAASLRIPKGADGMKAGDIVKCKAEWWANAYGDETRAVTWHDPPRMVLETKRVGGANFLRFEDVPNLWFWDDGFERAALN